jgi:hypothetical protein
MMKFNSHKLIISMLQKNIDRETKLNEIKRRIINLLHDIILI